MYLCPPVANERKGSLRVMYRAKADRIRNQSVRSFLTVLPAYCLDPLVCSGHSIDTLLTDQSIDTLIGLVVRG